MIQLTQVQIAQIVSNAVSQALTHQLQQLGNIPSTAAGNNTTHNTVAAQQYQTPIKFDVPAFEGDSSIKLVDVESKSFVPGQSEWL